MRFTWIAAFCALLQVAAFAADPYVWDFEAADISWRPRADTVTIERVEGVGASADSKASLRVHGTSASGWNYAMSDSRPMTPGQAYRLTVWMRVDSIGKTTPPPFVKCEFVPAESGKDLGRANTMIYNIRALGTWQELIVEFRAPEGTATCWLALEKGGSIATEIDAFLDNIKLEEIDKPTQSDEYALDPMPETMTRLSGVHPRIYLTDEKIAYLREAVKTTHAGLWEEILQQADAAVKSGAPKYVEDDGHSGAEQLWQRGVGNTQPVLALAWVISQDTRYLDAAKEWALASCSYPTWGLGNMDGHDLAAGHQLFGLGIVYDWCYEDLDAQTRATILDTIRRRGVQMAEYGAKRGSYLQNHLWVDACGLAIAAATYDEIEDAAGWLGIARGKFRTTMTALGPDGASHEGAPYWDYGAEYMLKFMMLARELLDEDMFDNDWWRNTAYYRLYLALPRNSWTRSNNVVDLADAPRNNWYGPDYILRCLAAEYRDGHAQWLAREIDVANVDSPSARWLNLLWYDPTVEATPPTDLPTLRHFADMDIVSARTDWSGDESLVVFKCGPCIGHEAIDAFYYDPGSGHSHPDANHFLIFGNGEWLIRDDGYREKWTGHHNTLLIDGDGQFGEGAMWFRGIEQLSVKAHPRIIRAESTPEMDIITGDATEVYPMTLGLTRYVRHLLFIKPGTVIVLDDIALDEPRNLELRFHPEQQEATQNGAAFLTRTANAALRIDPLTADDATVNAGMVAGSGRAGAPFSMYTIQLQKRAAAWRNATAFTWSTGNEDPVEVSMEVDGDAWVFHAGDRTVSFDWASGEVALEQ